MTENKIQASIMERLMQALLLKRTGTNGPTAMRIPHRSRGGIVVGRHSGDDPRGGSVRSILSAGPYSRVRSSIQTGTPPHVRRWRAEFRLKTELQKLPIGSLAGSAIPVERLTGAGFSSVWDLANANRARLLDVPGIGPKTLNKIHAALVERRVPVSWKAL